MTTGTVSERMRSAAVALVRGLDDEQRAQAALPFADEAARRWLEYRPSRRPGVCLGLLSLNARKAAHRLLATALSDRAYAQAMAIIALEEVLDRQEGWQVGRHRSDYWVSVFGEPAADEPWAWRFEGHHLSVSMTLRGEDVSPAPVFLGANPARVSYAGLAVSRPLAPEEDLAHALIEELGPGGRAVAVVADEAPPDIRSGTRSTARQPIEPLGIAAASLGPRGVLRLGRRYCERHAALLPGPGRRFANRVRQYGRRRQSRAHRVAPAARRLRGGHTRHALRRGSLAS